MDSSAQLLVPPGQITETAEEASNQRQEHVNDTQGPEPTGGPRLGHEDVATFTCSAPGSSRRKFLHQRDGLERRGVALGVDEVARGSLRATVTFVLTTNRLQRKPNKKSEKSSNELFRMEKRDKHLKSVKFNTVKIDQIQNFIL